MICRSFWQSWGTDSVTTGRAEDIRWSGKNSREGQQSQESGTTISGAGSVSLEAGRDLTA
ncbi:hypothetical protein A8M77_27820 [Variovorax sp. JS1663]|nr:hypothetical protein A8M77_27820 [Variovorax sp. JS1663]